MKCYSYSVEHDYYFCSANRKECEEILRPFLRHRRELDNGLQYEELFSSSEEFLDESILFQNKVRTQHPYTSLTLDFTSQFHVFPQDYIYFVINSKQDEIYIVPFYVPLKRVWSDYDSFIKIDPFEFSNLLELFSHPVTKSGKELERRYLDYNRVDLNEVRFTIRKKINAREVTTLEEVYSLVYPFFQNYQIFYGEFLSYFTLSHCYLPDIFHSLDQMNLHLMKDYFEHFPKQNVLSFEKERLEKRYHGNVRYVFYDYLDNKIPLSVLNELTNLHFETDSETTEEEIKEKMWYFLLDYDKRKENESWNA